MSEPTHSQQDENAIEREWERRWRKREVWGLWIAAGVGLLAILFSSFDSHEQKASLDHQRDVMQAQLNEMRAERRPWIEPGELTVNEVTVGDEKAYIRYAFSFKNIGRSVAQRVKISSAAKVTSVFDFAFRDFDCSKMTEESLSTTLFPNAVKTIPYAMLTAPIEKPAKGIGSFTVALCMSYEFEGSKQARTTRAVFIVRRKYERDCLSCGDGFTKGGGTYASSQIEVASYDDGTFAD